MAIVTDVMNKFKVKDNGIYKKLVTAIWDKKNLEACSLFHVEVIIVSYYFN